MKAHSKQDGGSVKQAGSFGLVGLINTAVDFMVLNLMTLLLHLPAVPANLLSTSTAQAGSFFLNRKFVFKQRGGNTLKKVLQFFAVTIIGLYVIQTIVIYLLMNIFTLPATLVTNVVHGIGFTGLSPEFISLNLSKVIATVFSAVWNFLWYKHLVFKDSSLKTEVKSGNIAFAPER